MLVRKSCTLTEEVEVLAVEDPDVIDVISFSTDGGRAALMAVEGRPLRDDDEQLFEIDRKLGAYMLALRTGQVPEVEDRLVTLVLVVPNEPRTPRAVRLLELIHERCLAEGLGFAVHVQTFPEEESRNIGLTDDELRPNDSEADPPAFPVVRVAVSADEVAQLLEDRADIRAWLDEQQRAADEPRDQRIRRLLGPDS